METPEGLSRRPVSSTLFPLAMNIVFFVTSQNYKKIITRVVPITTPRVLLLRALLPVPSLCSPEKIQVLLSL